MKIRFWGVRGSLPIPGDATLRYGGNTPCMEVQGAGDECIIMEAGTGIRPLGLDMLKRGKSLPAIHLFISHTHWDHIQGFPFFAPNYIPEAKIDIKGPVHLLDGKTLEDVFANQMQYEFFPVSNQQLAADITYESLGETTFEAGNIMVNTLFSNHPIRCLGYRLDEAGRSLFYTGDHEPYFDMFAAGPDEAPRESGDDELFGNVGETVEEATNRFVQFFKGVDLFIVDCQYTPDEYPCWKRNWGHSSWDYCLSWMKEAQVDRMVLTHHDPSRTDDELDAILAAVRRSAQTKGIDPRNILLAREGMELNV